MNSRKELRTVSGDLVRPSKKDEALATYLCERMQNEGLYLHDLCNQLGVKYSTIAAWLRKEHAEVYQEAQQGRADYWAWKIMTAANVQLQGNAFDNAKVMKAKLLAENYRWIASKLAPKQYGDKTQITGKDEGPIEFAVVQYAKTIEREPIEHEEING